MSLKELYLGCLRSDSAALAAAARTDPSARIPSCPDWNEHDLVNHLGRIQQRVLQVATERSQEPILVADMPPGPEQPAASLAWFEAGATALVAALDGMDEEEPVWNWAAGVAPVRFWMRRMSLETALHRWDGQSGTGEPEPVDTDLAVHGVEEMTGLFLPMMTEKAQQVRSDGTTMHLHCTDADGEWLLRFGAAGVETTREHAKGDVAVRGSASDLYLLLWNRVGPDRCEVFGDASVLSRFAEVVRL